MTTRDHTRTDAARLLRISTRTLDRLVSEGRLGYYRHGSRMTFGDCHLDEYRASIEVKAAQLRKVS